jgi:hypothetical protein
MRSYLCEDSLPSMTKAFSSWTNDHLISLKGKPLEAPVVNQTQVTQVAMTEMMMGIEDPQILEPHVPLITTHPALTIPGKLPLTCPMVVDMAKVVEGEMVPMEVVVEMMEPHQVMKTLILTPVIIEAQPVASCCTLKLPTDPSSLV